MQGGFASHSYQSDFLLRICQALLDLHVLDGKSRKSRYTVPLNYQSAKFIYTQTHFLPGLKRFYQMASYPGKHCYITVFF
jgi:hypothetical protein